MKHFIFIFFILIGTGVAISQITDTIQLTQNQAISDSITIETNATDSAISLQPHTPDSTQYLKDSAFVSKPDSIDQIPTELLLVLKVVDSLTNVPLEATVHTRSFGSTRGRTRKGEGICDASGKFQFRLLSNSIVEITIIHPGYHRYITLIDVKKEHITQQSYTKVCKLSAFKKGDIVLLNNIGFKQGDDHLLPSSYPTLDKLILMMEANPHMVIKLNGHTETTGSSSLMKKLSQKRVNSVRFYLIQNGIKVSRIKSVGYGGSKPLYTGKDPEKQRSNRRVELEIVHL